MKYGFVVWAILLSSVCAVAGTGQVNAPEKPLSPVEQTLMAAEKSFVEAAKKGDVAYLQAHSDQRFFFRRVRRPVV